MSRNGNRLRTLRASERSLSPSLSPSLPLSLSLPRDSDREKLSPFLFVPLLPLFLVPSFSLSLCRERETETDRERETETDRQTDRHEETERDRERGPSRRRFLMGEVPLYGPAYFSSECGILSGYNRSLLPERAFPTPEIQIPQKVWLRVISKKIANIVSKQHYSKTI